MPSGACYSPSRRTIMTGPSGGVPGRSWDPPLRDRARITSDFSACSFALELCCASVTGPFPGHALSLRLAPGQKPGAAKSEVILARSLSSIRLTATASNRNRQGCRTNFFRVAVLGLILVIVYSRLLLIRLFQQTPRYWGRVWRCPQRHVSSCNGLANCS